MEVRHIDEERQSLVDQRCEDGRASFFQDRPKRRYSCFMLVPIRVVGFDEGYHNWDNGPGPGILNHGGRSERRGISKT